MRAFYQKPTFPEPPDIREFLDMNVKYHSMAESIQPPVKIWGEMLRQKDSLIAEGYLEEDVNGDLICPRTDIRYKSNFETLID